MGKALWLSLSIMLAAGAPLRAESRQMTRALLNALEESGDADLAFDHASLRRPAPSLLAGSGAARAPLGSPQLSRELRLSKSGIGKAPKFKSRSRLKDNSGLAFGVMAAGGGLGIWGCGVVLAGIVGGGLPVAILLGLVGFVAGASTFNYFFPS